MEKELTDFQKKNIEVITSIVKGFELATSNMGAVAKRAGHYNRMRRLLIYAELQDALHQMPPDSQEAVSLKQVLECWLKQGVRDHMAIITKVDCRTVIGPLLKTYFESFGICWGKHCECNLILRDSFYIKAVPKCENGIIHLQISDFNTDADIVKYSLYNLDLSRQIGQIELAVTEKEKELQALQAASISKGN